jgi:hypothetical protein
MPDASPQINTGTSLDSVIGNIQDPTERAILKDETARENKVQDFTEKKIAERDATEIPKAPVLEKAPDQKDYTTDPMQTFGSAAMILGTFGGLLTKNPIETALNSGAAVMNAANKKDAAAFNKAFDKWKIDSENAWKMAQWNQDAYKTALGKSDEDVKLYATMFKNDTAAHALTAKMHEQDLRAQEKALEKAKGATGAIIDYVNSKEQEARDSGKSDAYIEANRIKWYGEAKALGSGKGNQDEQLANIDWKKLKPDDPVPGTGLTASAIKVYGDAIADGVRPSQLGLGYGMNPVKKAVDNYVAATHPGFKMSDAELGYTGAQSEARTTGTSASRIKLAANSLDQVIPLARDAMKNVDLTNFTDLNSFENYARTHTGDPNITALNTAIQTVISDYSSLISRNGQQTDSTRAAARELVNSNMASGQLDAFFDQVEKEKGAQLRAIDVTRGKGLAGKPPDDKHVKMLKDDPSEQNIKYFDEAFGQGSAAKYLGE